MTTTFKTLADVKTAIESTGDDSYFDYTFARWVADTYKVNVEDAQKMVRLEAQEAIEDGLEKGRGKEGRAQKRACRSILAWLTEAHEYAVKLDQPRDIANFVGSHRRACVWAVLIGKTSGLHGATPYE